jgi:transcriptional regulator with GAF, ATPase, and Fis domain
MAEASDATPEFEAWLADLSTRFTGLPGDQVDAEVQRALREVVEVLDTDRSTLFEFAPDGTSLRPTHSWARPPIEPVELYTSSLLRADLPWAYDRLLRGEVLRFERLPDDVPPEESRDREYLVRTGLKANLTIPIAVGGRFVCAVATGTFRAPRTWSDLTVARVRTVGQVLANAVHRQRTEAELRATLAAVRELEARLEAENLTLREEVERVHGFDEIVGRSPALQRVLAQVAHVAPTSTTVLLTGETGTGKELLARAIHRRSPRRHRALVTVNCAALPPTLIESELFGHERGAFTGATTTKAGRFELAHEGTLLLDEIAELPVDVQAKLLRVLQAGEFERVGGTRTFKVDVRIIAATNRDLARGIAEGRFRDDLYYRLSAFPIALPPLRERREDIPLLVWSIIERRQPEFGRHIDRVPKPVMEALVHYAWPGNVRELENVIERALILSAGRTLSLDESFGALIARPGADRLDHVEREHLRRVLERCGWRINGQGHAADVLGLHPNTLRSRMAKLGIRRPARRAEPRP